MTGIQPAAPQLVEFACAARPDWDRDAARNALVAAHAAGWQFSRTVREVVRLLLIEDSTPNDLRIAAGETRLPVPAEHTPEEVADLKAQALAAAAAASERIREQRRDGTAA